MGATERIIERLLPEFAEHQREKAKDYNDSLVPGVENADVLGERGQYSELWRKMAKLKKALWDGQPLVGEQPREILLDFIGHCFLAIDMIDRRSAEVVPDRIDAVQCPYCKHSSALHPDQDKGGKCVGGPSVKPCYCERSFQEIHNDFTLVRTGHGYDGCPVCVANNKIVEESDAHAS